jgi:hypothetical protein
MKKNTQIPERPKRPEGQLIKEWDEHKIEKPKKEKKHRWQDFKVAFFYDETHTVISRTAIMNVIFFICAIATLVTGIVAKLVMNKELPSNIYLFVSGLTGGGFLQYSYTKFLNVKKATSQQEPEQ